MACTLLIVENEANERSESILLAHISGWSTVHPPIPSLKWTDSTNHPRGRQDVMIPAPFDPTFTLVVEPSTITAITAELADRLRTLIAPCPYDEPYEIQSETPTRAISEFAESSELASMSGRLYSAVQLAILAVADSHALPTGNDSKAPPSRRRRTVVESVFDQRGPARLLPFAGDPRVVAWQRGSGVCVVNLSSRFAPVRRDWGTVLEFSAPVASSAESTLLVPYSTAWLARGTRSKTASGTGADRPRADRKVPA